MDLKETTDHFLLKWKHHGLKLSGICGIFAPVVAFTGIILAVEFYPGFSWANNALSDMGSSDGLSRLFFNNGLMVGGLIATAFAAGFSLFLKKGKMGKIGTAAFVLDALALAAIGLFPGDFAPQTHIHYYVSVAFFVLFPISAFALGASFFHSKRMRLAALTAALAIVAAGAWLAHLTLFPFGPGVAIPETVSAAAAGIWALAVGINMVRAADD